MPSSRRQLPNHIGHFTIVRALGEGGMGVVYQAYDASSKREVALKVLRGRQASPHQLRRFEREAQALALLRHPAIVRIYSTGEHEGSPYLVMELVVGDTLGDRIRGQGPLPEGEALRIGLALAQGLAYIHAESVLHRDLKPGNVVLAADGRPVIVDFGLAKLLANESQRITRSQAFVGTPGFAAPEQLRDAAHVDAKADVYSLGAILYAMATGVPPGGQENAGGLALLLATEQGTWTRPRELRPDLSPEFETLIARTLAGEASERPSAGEVATGIANLLDGTPARPSRVKPILTFLAVVALAVAGALAAATVTEPSAPAAAESPGSEGAPNAPEHAPTRSGFSKDLREPLRDLRQALAALHSLPPAEVEAAYERTWKAARRASAARGTPAQELERDLLRARLSLLSARWLEALTLYQDLEATAPCASALGEGLVLLWSDFHTERAQARWRHAATLEARTRDERSAAWLCGVLEGALNGQLQSYWGEHLQGFAHAHALAGDLMTSLAVLAAEREEGPSYLRALSGLERKFPPPRWCIPYAFARTAAVSNARPTLRNLAQGLGAMGTHWGDLLALAPVGVPDTQWVRASESASLFGRIDLVDQFLSQVSHKNKAKIRLRARHEAAKFLNAAYVGEIAGSGRLRCRIPAETAGGLLTLLVPSGCRELRVELSGFGVDCDLYLRRGGVPDAAHPHTLSSTFFARDETLSMFPTKGQKTLRPGLHQIFVKRFAGWPEAVAGEVSVRTLPDGKPAPYPWKRLGQSTLDGAPSSLRPALRSSAKDFAAGRWKEADLALARWMKRVPAVALLRVRRLVYAERHSEAQAVIDEARSAGFTSADLRFVETGLLFLGSQEKGLEAAQRLAREHPQVLEIRLQEVLFFSSLGRHDQAALLARALLRLDPAEPWFPCLARCHAALHSGKGDVDQLVADARRFALVPNRLFLILNAIRRVQPDAFERAMAGVQEAIPEPIADDMLTWVQAYLTARRPQPAAELIGRYRDLAQSPWSRASLHALEQGMRR
jgi:predicted Ser/Thr protein kinase